MAEKPLLFISHRHEQEGLAQILYDFIQERTLGNVDLFCSSRAEAAPTPGASLSEELGAKLAKARVLALVYTRGAEDWSYCMYECGLATDPTTPTTRVVVFQCTGDVPRVYTDAVRVSVHDQESVRSFVISLLTNPDFFPGYGEAIAPNFAPDSPDIARMAEELGIRLREASPPPDPAPDDEWPAFDAMTLELPLAIAEQIHDAETQEEERDELIIANTLVKGTDKFCPQLFGMRSVQADTTLKTLFEQWAATNPNLPDDWTAELVRQISEAAAWRFPKVRWITMSTRDRNDQYVPGIHYVRKIPADDCLRFETYFLPVLAEA